MPASLLALLLAALPAAAAPAPRLPQNHLKVPLVPQATSYSCGAAAMLAVLLYWNLIDANESSLYEALGTSPEQGTHPARIRDHARKLGLKAEIRTGLSLEDLEKGLAAGHTLIVDFQAWADWDTALGNPDYDYRWKERWEDGHYAVLVAMDRDFLWFMDPSSFGRYAYMPRQELLERWRDYEEEDGKRVEYQRMAIDIWGGKSTLKSVPAEPIRLL